MVAHRTFPRSNHTPAPGTYDVTPKWKLSGGVRMKEPSSHSVLPRSDRRPGPGDYNVSQPLNHSGYHVKNPRSAMGGTTDRFPHRKPDGTPGPADYDPIPPVGSFQTRTFNVVMADEEAMRRV